MPKPITPAQRHPLAQIGRGLPVTGNEARVLRRLERRGLLVRDDLPLSGFILTDAGSDEAGPLSTHEWGEAHAKERMR